MNNATHSKQTVTIKKYANRRLYNTATSSYVTLEDLSTMVKEGTDFCVYDAKTSEDITRSVLTQIIVEEESKSGQQNLLPIGFLRNLIGYYGDNMQWMVPKYLEHSMELFSNNQDQIKSYFQNTFGSVFPFGTTFEEVSKQNLAMFERAMRMFNPMTMGDTCSCDAQKTTCDCGGSKSDNVTNLNTTRTTHATNTTTATNTASSTNSSTPSATTASNATMEATASCCTGTQPKAFCTCSSENSNVSSCCCATDNLSASISAPESPTINDATTTSSAAPSIPTPNVSNATASSETDDMQQKIANLQRQLAELAKNRA